MSKRGYFVYCEDFYSIQGEGASAGVPAVFLRLAGCNLQCPGFSYQDPNTGEHLGCDSKALWRRGQRISHHEVLERWEQAGWIAALASGAHCVITGGEPMVQQQRVLEFIHSLDTAVGHPVYIELETNATIMLDECLLQRLNQINASPKLAHSGEEKLKAYVPGVLEQLASCDKTQFKFVVAQPLDVEEVMRDYVHAFFIPKSRVWLMPEGGTQKQLQTVQLWLVEACKRHCVNFSPRLQVLIWDEVTGV